MIGSMFVGFIIGLIAGAITSRGERMGCSSISARSSYPLGYFLETGQLEQKKRKNNSYTKLLAVVFFGQFTNCTFYYE